MTTLKLHTVIAIALFALQLTSLAANAQEPKFARKPAGDCGKSSPVELECPGKDCPGAKKPNRDDCPPPTQRAHKAKSESRADVKQSKEHAEKKRAEKKVTVESPKVEEKK